MNIVRDIVSLLEEKKSNDLIKEAKLLTDEKLVEKIIDSENHLLFGILYERYQEKVYRKCYGFVKNDDEAEDLTQEIFIKLYGKINRFQGRAKFSTWLYVFTYNFCVNYITRDKEKKVSSLAERLKNKEHKLSAEESELDEDFYEIKMVKMEKALEMISPEDKAILMLKYHDNIPVKELQILLDINESALKMRLKRAKIKAVEAHKKIR